MFNGSIFLLYKCWINYFEKKQKKQNYFEIKNYIKYKQDI